MQVVDFWPHQGGGGHLAAGHAVGGVVGEENGYVLAAVGGHQYLRKTYGRQISVALIHQHGGIGTAALDAGGHGRRTPVGGGDHVQLPVERIHGGAAHRQHVYHVSGNAQLVDGFGDELGRQGMQTAGAEAAGQRQQAFGFRIDFFGHHCSPPFMISSTAAFVVSSSSSTPPLRPYS
jgi:hypothetical protein